MAAFSLQDSQQTEQDSCERLVCENYTLDLESYIAPYTGHTKTLRLLFIASHCINLRHDCLQRALSIVEKTLNAELYIDICRQLQQPLDEDWVIRIKKERRIREESLNADLKNYRNNFMKQSIRMGLEDLANHYYECGDLPNVLKSYQKVRDYVSSPHEFISMQLNIIMVNMELENWAQVKTYAERAESFLANPNKDGKTGQATEFSPSRSGERASLSTQKAKVMAALGLCHLHSGHYRKAAQRFLKINEGLPSMMTTNDIAVYTTLTALATFTRSEISTQLLQNKQFVSFLEVEPSLLQMLQSSYNAKHDETMRILESRTSDFMLDMYLWKHIAPLTELIKKSALLQYCEPFKRARLDRMAAKLRLDRERLEEELFQMILAGKLQAKIDTKNDILQMTKTDSKTSLATHSMKSGEKAMQMTRHLLLRFSCIQAGFVVLDEAASTDQDRRQQVANPFASDEMMNVD